MSLMLKRGIEVLVGAALVVGILAVLPAVAEAQDMAAPQDARSVNRGAEAARSVVVRPGDSLWSISSERLGPNARPRQITNTVEQIYALNRNRIGSDPNMIFSGQVLLLPPVARAAPARNAAEPAESGPTGRGTKSGPEQVSSATIGEAGSKIGQAHEPVAEPVVLPDMPAKQPAPKVSSLSATDAPSPDESFVRTARSLLSSATSAVGLLPQDDHLRSRKLLGLGIIALTVLVAGLIAWKLPLNRNVGGGRTWGISSGYVSNYTYSTEATDRYGSTPVSVLPTPVAEPDSRSIGDGESPAAPAVEKDLNGAAAMIVVAQRRRERDLREQERGARRSPHAGLATGAHNPQVTRHLRRARTPTPGWTVARRPPTKVRALSPKGGQL